jgi:hypothetical protein
MDSRADPRTNSNRDTAKHVRLWGNNNDNYEYYNDNTTTAAVTHFRAKTHITNT